MKKSIFNIPNQLTLARLILSVLFFVLLQKEYYFASGLIFIVASVTDFLDGYLARKYKLVTNLGAIMDPLADKILVFAAFILFYGSNIIPAWFLFVLLFREFAVSIFRITAAKQGTIISAAKMGKAKTATQMVAIILVCFQNYPFGIWNIPMDQILLYFSLFLAVVSGIEYLYKNRDILKE